MFTAFSGIIAMMGEEVTVLRHTRQAHLSEARHAPRGLERDVDANYSMGAYHKNNAMRIEIRAIIWSQSARTDKRVEGELRGSILRIKSNDPIYSTDDANSSYSDLIHARGELHKLTDVRFDPGSQFYIGQLEKVSDDRGVDTGAR